MSEEKAGMTNEWLVSQEREKHGQGWLMSECWVQGGPMVYQEVKGQIAENGHSCQPFLVV